MMAPDLWSAVWLLVDQYTWVVVILVLLMLCFLGTVVACALMALTRPEDDQAQHRPAGQDKPAHQVHIRPAPDLIPWGRRMQPPADKP